MRTPEVAPVKYSSLGIELSSERALEKDLDITEYPPGSNETGTVKAKSYSCWNNVAAVSAVLLFLCYCNS